MEMTDLHALARGIYKLKQAVSETDTTCQDMVMASIMFAEASMGDHPDRKERLNEFYRIANDGA